MNIRHFHTSFDPNIIFFASRPIKQIKPTKRVFVSQQTSKNSLLLGFNFSHQEALRLGNGFVCRYRSQAEDRLASLEASKQILFPLTQSAKFRIFLIRRDMLIRRTQYCWCLINPSEHHRWRFVVAAAAAAAALRCSETNKTTGAWKTTEETALMGRFRENQIRDLNSRIKPTSKKEIYVQSRSRRRLCSLC